MKPISSDIIEKTWKKLGGMSPRETQKLVDLMKKEQPFILVYLMAVGNDILNQDERELLLYLGMVVWQIMSQGETPLSKITEKILDNMEKSNIKMLEYLEDESDDDFIDIVEMTIIDYSQQEVIKYVVEALMEEPDEDCMIRDKNKGIMMIYLKTVIDCFNK